MAPKRVLRLFVGLALAAALTGTTAACGSTAASGESNPAGDIPDDVAFVPYTNAVAGYSFTHPEGWAQQETGPAVTFTDKLNGVSADTDAIPPTLDEATV